MVQKETTFLHISRFFFSGDTWVYSQGPDMEKCRPPPKPRVKAKSSFSGQNYFVTMHHQAEVHFENFTEVKFRDILLTGTGHRDRRLNRDSPGQTGACDRSNLNQNLNLT